MYHACQYFAPSGPFVSGSAGLVDSGLHGPPAPGGHAVKVLTPILARIELYAGGNRKVVFERIVSEASALLVVAASAFKTVFVIVVVKG